MFEINMCEPGEMVELRPELKNKHDPQAIAVYSARGIQIGYIRAERAPFIGKAMRDGIVQAIFQQKELWGATIRAHLDGSEAVLPEPLHQNSTDSTRNRCHELDWWPDEQWPD